MKREREKERERECVLGKCVLAVRLDDDEDDIYIYIYIYIYKDFKKKLKKPLFVKWPLYIYGCVCMCVNVRNMEYIDKISLSPWKAYCDIEKGTL